VGSLRTYLANWLWARRQGGQCHLVWQEAWKALDLAAQTELVLRRLRVCPDRTHLTDWWHGPVLRPLLCAEGDPRHQHYCRRRYQLRAACIDQVEAIDGYWCTCAHDPGTAQSHHTDPCQFEGRGPREGVLTYRRLRRSWVGVSNPVVAGAWTESGHVRCGWHAGAWHAITEQREYGTTHSVRGRDCDRLAVLQAMIEQALGLPPLKSRAIGLVVDGGGPLSKSRPDTRPLTEVLRHVEPGDLVRRVFASLQPDADAPAGIDDMVAQFDIDAVPHDDVSVTDIMGRA
jgi:hypothetical protein